MDRNHSFTDMGNWGTYKPMYSPQDRANYGTRAPIPFSIVNNLYFYDGFSGTEITLSNLDLNNTEKATILSGNIGI